MGTDLLRAAWLIGVAVAIVALAPSARPRWTTIGATHRLAVVTLLAIGGVSILSSAQLLNWFTLLLVYTAPAALAWLGRYEWAPERAFRHTVRTAAIAAAARLEAGLPRPGLAWRRPAYRVGDSLLLLLAVGLALAGALRFLPALGELRLSSPEAYALLLDARLALFNAPQHVIVDPFAALTAALSIATSLSPSHVIRLLAPAVGVATVAAAAAVAGRLSNNRAAAAAVAWILGVCTVGPRFAAQWIANDRELAVLFALLCVLAVLHARRLHWRDPALRTAGLCAVIAAVSAPWTLVLLAVVPLSSYAGRGMLLLHRFVTADRRRALQPAAVAAAVAACFWLAPASATTLYLEHEVAARQTLEIVTSFPRGKWLVVAPLEQLSGTYGRGWFEDQLSFLNKYEGRTTDATFRFEASVDDILVFVERRPFKTFDAEASSVPFSAMTDPTYRNYRSQAGRASLQARLRRLCDDYLTTHEDASVYYDDDDLTIYRFPVAR